MDSQANSIFGSSRFNFPDLIDFLPDATFMIGLDGRVILWNRAMESLTGVAVSAMLGRGDYEYSIPFYGERRPMLVDIVMHPELAFSDRYYLFKKTDDLLSGETVVPSLKGSQRHLWGNAMLVRNSEGVVIGAVETIRDITDVKFSLERLLAQTEKCRQAFENIQDVYYEVNLDGTFIEISPSVKNVLGWQREELIGTSVALLYAEPADRNIFLRSITSNGGVDDYEITMKRRDGSLLNISINARYFPGDDHDPPRNIGSMRNITPRKKVEEALRISEERYRTLIENIPVAINRTTPPPNGRFLMVNPAFLRMFGFASESEAMMCDPVETYFDPEERKIFARQVIEKGGLNAYEMRFRKKDGSTIWGAMTAKAVYDKKSGEPLFFDCIIEDVTERKKTEEEMRRLAYYDALTGLPNRALFMDRLNMAIARASREKGRVALMMFDLDFFKDVNDTMGHLAGDQLLRGVARRLQKQLRKSDTIARLGGDEFMVIYAGVSDHSQVDMLAGKLLDVFARPFRLDKKQVRITASIGVAVYPDDADDLDMMLRKVDVALYRAKDNGGNTSMRCSDANEEESAVRLSRGRFSDYLNFAGNNDQAEPMDR